MKPLCVDLFCGLGGWAEGFLSENYWVVGFDIEHHDYGKGTYPGDFVMQDVLTLHGSQFKTATCIVASPPCQAYSYRAMPWSRAKALPPPDNSLFEACFRIQREACAAAGRYIPMVVENVRGAQKWVGRAKWHHGSYFLWGDVPTLMPIIPKRAARKVPGFRFDGSGRSFQTAAVESTGQKTPSGNCSPALWKDREIARYCHPTLAERPLIEAHHGVKVRGLDWSKHGEPGYKAKGFNVTAAQNYREGVKQSGISGVRNNGKGDRWFQDGAARHGSKSNSRKAASAEIAQIPFPLASHIARCFA